MRRPIKPFIVEVRQKRSYQKRDNSIWADIDLSAAVAETNRHFEQSEHPFIDSNVALLDAERSHAAIAEYQMTVPEQEDSVAAAPKGAVKGETSETKRRTRGPKNVEPAPGVSSRKNGATPASGTDEALAAARPGRRIYSAKERASKLRQIEKSMQDGATLKSAVKHAGTSEQTYYQWKKKAAVAVPASDDLKDLLVLEEENKRLRTLLADRLRKENADLKRRLGLQ
jgi:hypothetical protein